MNDFLMIVLQSSMLILALLLIRKLFMGKINPLIQYSLWGVAALRLFTPVRIESAWSLFNIAKFTSAERIAAPMEYDAPNSTVVSQNTAAAPPTQSIIESINASDPVVNSISTPEIIETVLLWVWVAGMVAVLAYTIVVNTRFCLHIHRNGRQEAGYIVCDSIASPCLVGLFRPKIILTEKAAADAKAREYALLHEQTHIKHGDNLWALLRALACVIYWFNPLVWIAASACRTDQEIACDHSVIKQIGEDNRIEYGEVLIALIRRKKSTLALTTAMASNKKDIRQRVKLIAKRPQMLKITAVALIAVVAVVSVAACTNPVSDKMPFDISADEASGAVFHYDRNPDRDPYFKEHALPDASAADIVNWLNESTEIVKADSIDAYDEYITLSIGGGSVVAIYPSDDAHIFFNRNSGTAYIAKNSELARYITQQAQAVIGNAADNENQNEPDSAQENESSNSKSVIGGADGPTEIVVTKSFDRTDPYEAAEEFLTRYFNDLCTGNTDWGWNDADYSQYDGLLAYSEDYYNDMCIMKQWIDYADFLAEKNDWYNRESAIGRFVSLEVKSFGILDSLGDAEFLLQGYFKTSAMGTVLEMGMKQSEQGEYQIVYAAFPDSKEYNNFAANFVEYTNLQGIKDYNKSTYIDHLRNRENEIREDWQAWQKAERIAAPYTKARSMIELSQADAGLNSNSTYLAETTDAGNGLKKDVFRTTRDDYPAENWPLLQVTYVSKDDMPEGMDFLGYASDMLDGFPGEIYSEIEEFEPQTFFGTEAPVVKLWRRTIMSEGMLSAQTDPIHDVYTRYFVHCVEGKSEYALVFDFYNALDYGVDGQAYDGWRLLQSLEDCEQWMKTLYFPEYLKMEDKHMTSANVSLMSLIGGADAIDSYRVSRAISGASAPVHTTVTDKEQLQAVLDILSQEAVSITEFSGYSGWSIVFRLYAGDTSVCLIKPVDERLFVSYNSKNYIVEYPSNISAVLLDALK